MRKYLKYDENWKLEVACSYLMVFIFMCDILSKCNYLPHNLCVFGYFFIYLIN